jgi:hypothetical protein
MLAESTPGVTLPQLRIFPEVLRSGSERLVAKNLKARQRPSIRSKLLLSEA